MVAKLPVSKLAKRWLLTLDAMCRLPASEAQLLEQARKASGTVAF